jgi:hypothetical protein
MDLALTGRAIVNYLLKELISRKRQVSGTPSKGLGMLPHSPENEQSPASNSLSL